MESNKKPINLYNKQINSIKTGWTFVIKQDPSDKIEVNNTSKNSNGGNQ